MFVVLLQYLAPLNKIDACLERHRTFLAKYYDLGKFIISGPRIPRENGGLILVDAEIRGQVDQIMKEDPFIQEGIASYELIPFEPTRHHDLLTSLMTQRKKVTIEVVPYDEAWPHQFEEIARELRCIFGDQLVDIHHIGSTSVPGLSAKPIIDVMPVVRDIEKIDTLSPLFEKKEYRVRGELGIICRRFFTKDNADGRRLTNIHTFQEGDPEVERHLLFRDFLRSHPETRAEYEALKFQLVKDYPHTREGYTGGKEAWIASIVERARAEL